MYSCRPDNRRRKKANTKLHPPPKSANYGFVAKQRFLAPPAKPPPSFF